jgi:hypothetical protein
MMRRDFNKALDAVPPANSDDIGSQPAFLANAWLSICFSFASCDEELVEEMLRV